MSVSVQSVIDRVQVTLQDTTGVRWPVANELVLWVNDAQREIALFKPDASAQNETITLVLGVVRNMSAASGGTGARSIRLVEREVLDAQTPTWHDPTSTGDAAHSAVVKHYVYDDSNPRNFYVYPGVSGNAYVEIIYSGNPSTVAQADNLTVPDIYANSVYNYVLYSCYMKDAEYTGNSQRAGNHYQLFMAAVTGKSQLDLVTSPNANTAAA